MTGEVIVVGGGLAGLSAAISLAEDGAKVTLIERRPQPGGRVYSYLHPALGETVDSQHVLVGCCTNLLSLLKKSGGAEAIRWYDEFTFIEPGGRRSVMRPGFLPAPAHQAISFLRAPMLSLRDKAGITRGMMEFLRGYPHDDSESFAVWLKRTGQTDQAVRHFWEPVVVATLNDTLDRCSTKYAGKVFYETFLSSAEGGRLGIPKVPLTKFLEPVVAYAQALGVYFVRAGVDRIESCRVGWRVVSGSSDYDTPALVMAANFKQTGELLPWLGLDLPAFKSSPITTIQLWFDRDVVGIDHAVLLDTRIQWMFSKSRIREWEPRRGSYLELAISASWQELTMPRETILADALSELALFFPAAREAKLLKSGVLKEARATFSVSPGMDRSRPLQTTPSPGLFLAGDWTATEWPSTMEGAVRSGRLAAGALAGERSSFLADELPATVIMRALVRNNAQVL